MTNDLIKAEILPPLPQNGSPLRQNTSPAPNESFTSDVQTPRESTPSSRARVSAVIKAVLIIFTVAVFIFAMYTEISSVLAKFVPDSFSDAVASLAFGGYYAIADPFEDSGDIIIHTPNVDHGEHLTEWEGSDFSDEIGGIHHDSAGSDAEGNGSGTVTDTDADRYPIVTRDLSTNAERGLICSNQTTYDLDLDYFADNEFALPSLAELQASFPPDTENPVVLIVHTHGTESYAEEGSDSYSKKDNSRTTDITKNVVAVGEVMAEYFESRGIPTVHCTEMFDRDSYIDAYNNSSAAVREYLAIYPSIRYIFDVHRDSIIADDYTKYRPVTEIDGTPTAQFMCVVGTNAKGANHPLWRDNLTLAAHLQVRLWNRSTSLPRRLSIRSASFYQQYAQGSLLLEIGSCGNTLSEAKACARIVAEELAEIIIAGE